MGDLSRMDAIVLKDLAQRHNDILEFGVGASTQILRNYSIGRMVSVDTMREWIDRTAERLKLFEIDKPVEFQDYTTDIIGNFDLVFVDGYSPLRYEWARIAWPHLKVGGQMAFHDTRSGWGMEFVAGLFKDYFLQIGRIEANISGSNITIFEKTKKKQYENWNRTEAREPHRRGQGTFNIDVYNDWVKNGRP